MKVRIYRITHVTKYNPEEFGSGGAGYIKGGPAGARDEHEAELCREPDV